MLKSRRQAREAALRALYEMEVGKVRLREGLIGMEANSDLPGELKEFAQTLVRGVSEEQALLDDKLSAVIQDWDFDRVAVVDKNLLRLAAYELFFVPGIPPAVSINEAIEIGKKYSTAESGKFINGVLGKLVQSSPKAHWNPAHAEVEELAPPEEEPAVEEITPDTPEAKELSRIGLWKVRSEPE